MSKIIRSVNLWCNEGRSDKVYNISLKEVNPRCFVVDFAYGRRGGTLKEGTKTETPVNLFSADSIFSELKASKIAKGYKEVGDKQYTNNPVVISVEPTYSNVSKNKTAPKSDNVAQISKGRKFNFDCD